MLLLPRSMIIIASSYVAVVVVVVAATANIEDMNSVGNFESATSSSKHVAIVSLEGSLHTNTQTMTARLCARLV